MNTIPEEFRGIGYKVFNKDLKCRGYQYEIGKQYEHTGKLEICISGFHLCDKLIDCFNYYEWNSSNRVCVVNYDSREIDKEEHGDKKAVRVIYISHELTWDEVMRACNHGHSNTGHSNTGDSNTGDRNTGDSNTGHSNTGHRNTGHSNTGHSNTGHSNTGHSNTGDWNTGHSNTGHSNTGDWNTGHSNTGHWNTGDRNTGYLCAETPKAFIFDEHTDLTHEQIKGEKWFLIMSRISFAKYIYFNEMNPREVIAHPSAKITGGYNKYIKPKVAWRLFWKKLSNDEKEIIKSIPNFTAVKWKNITGITI